MKNTFYTTYQSFSNFSKILLVNCMVICLFCINANAQIPVTVTNNTLTTPNLASSYLNLAAALSDLNLVTSISPGTVTLTLGSGSESAPNAGLTIGSTSLNATLAAGAGASNIVIINTGGTAVLNAGTTGTGTPGTAIQDGILKIVGADYITINGLTLVDGNISNPASMEFGIGLFKMTATDGAQFNTIQNCIITLNKVNNASGTAPAVDGSRGINVMNAFPATQTTVVTVTAASGANSGNKFYSNTIQNCNIGIALIGFAAASPFTLADVNNDIGGSSVATGNIIKNFGGASAAANPAAGVRTLAQYGLNVSYNNVNSNDGAGVNHLSTLRGIFTNTATSASETVSFNTVSIKGGGTTSSIIAIENVAGSTAAGNTISINNNTITGCTYTTATSGTFTGIFNNAATPATLNMNNNQLTNNATHATSGTTNMIQNSGAVTLAVNINSNVINGMTYNAVTSGAFVGIVSSSAVSTSTIVTINSNDFQGINYTTLSTAANTYISVSGVPLTFTANSNTFTNLNISTSGTTTFILETYSATATGTKNVTNNSIVTAFNRGGASGSVLFISDNGSSAAGSLSSVINNNFSNVTVAGTSTITGLNLTDGGAAPTKTITGNTFNNITGGTGTINVINITYWTGVSTLSNNTVTNITGQGIVTGITMGSTVNTATSITVASNTINNLTSTGAGGNVTGLVCTNTSSGINIRNNSIRTLSSTGASVVTGLSIGGTASTTNALKNVICDLSGSNAGSTVNGILVSAGATVTLSNNIVGILQTPVANAANPLNGINITAGTTVNVYYNTVYINAISSGALFGSTAISASTTPTLTLNNNIFVNNSIPNGAGLSAAYRRSSATLTSYASASNRNIFFASTIFTDGTNTFTSFGPGVGTYKDFVATRDANSFSDNPPFISTTCGDPNFLHISLSTATAAESGGANISGITDDYDNHIRFGNGGYAGTGTAPDIGADEMDGIPLPACTGTPTAGSINGVNSVCSGFGTTLTLTGATIASGLTYQWASGTTSGGPYPATLGTTTSQATGPLTVTTYYVVTVTCTNSGSSSTTIEKEVLVKPLPTVSVSPTSGSICRPGGNAITITASGNSTSYSWTPASGLSANTGSTVIANPISTTTYIVTGSLNGCTSSATSAITILTGTTVNSVTATPANICTGGSSQLTAVAQCYEGGIKITELTQFRTGTGATSPYPAFVIAAPDDYVEISNISTSSIDVSGLVYELWTGTTLNRTVTIPASTILPSNSVLIIALGTGTDDPANRYFNTGGTNGPLSSSTAAGHLIKAGGVIVDAVALTSYAWPVASGITASDWTGNGLAASGAAGVIRTVAQDNNNVSDWIISTASSLQTIGTYNGGFTPTSCTFSYAWSPSTFLSSTTGATVNAIGVTSTTTYTVTATAASGCTATGTVTVFAGETLVCGALTTAGTPCAGIQTVTAHPSGGGTPYSYAWTENGNAFGGNTQTITASTGTHTYNCVVTDFCSNTCSSGNLFVTTNALPVVTASPVTALLCRPYDPAITITASGASSYSWTPAAGLTATSGSSVNANPLYTTIYTVTGTDVNSCVDETTVNITVGNTPLALSASAFPPAVCSGATSNLTSFSYSPTVATVNNYVFLAGTNATLDPMTGATIVIAAPNEGTPTAALPIGFNFNFDGVDFTNYSVSPDGFIKLGDVAATIQATNTVASTTNIPKIYAYWDDLHTGIDGSVKALVTGTAPGRILKIQWETTIPKLATGNFNSTFQVWLYESANIIEYRYGTMGVPSASSSGGITGNPATNFHSITFTTKTSSNATANNTQIFVPPSGTIFTYAPPSAAITYSWQPAGDVVSPGSQNTATNALTNTTVFTVTATNGQCSATTTATVTAGAPLNCSAATSSSPICNMTDFTVTANHTGGGAPFSYAWNDGSTTVYPNAQTITPNLPAGTYTFTAVVSDDCGESCASDVIVTVLGSPSVFVNPSSGSICSPGGTAITLTASGSATGYTWSPAAGLDQTTGNTVSANPGSSTIYTVTGIDGNGCTSIATSTISVSTSIGINSVTATPASVCSGGNSQLTATASCLSGALKITEVTQFRTGTGATSPYPAHFVAGDFDYVEVSNVSGVSVDASGLIYEVWTGTALLRTLTIPASTIIPSNGVLVIALGTGTDDPANLYFHTGGTTGPLQSSTPAGHLIRQGSAITDAVALTSYAWPVASGVTASDWTGNGLAASGRAGVIRTVANDNNDVSDWELSNSPSPLQTIGTYNGGYTTTSCALNYSWSPATFLTTSTGSTVNATGITSTTTYTVTVTEAGGCTATGTVTVTAGAQLVCAPATVSPATCANTNFSVTANHSGGGSTFNYAWSDGSTTVYPNTKTITANLPAGTYTFTATVTDDCGATCPSSITVTVNNVPSVSVIPTTGQICNPGGSAVTLTASGAPSYSWSPAAGLNTSTGSVVSANPVSSTTYTVTGSDGNGCASTATSFIQVGTFPVNVTATATPSAICPGTFSQLSATGVVSSSLTVNNYLFSAGSGASLDPMTGATQVLNPSNDDTPTAASAPIGFAFTYDGNTYSNFSVSPDGWILLGNATAVSQFTNAVTSTTNIPKIYPYWDDLATGTDGNVKVLVTGTSPTRIFKVQWQVTIPRATTGASNSTFQAWLYESSNLIEFRYGTLGTPTSTTISGGLTGSVATNFQSLTFVTNTSSSVTANNANAATAPANGTIYSYVPPSGTVTFSWQPAAGLKPNANVQNPETPGLFSNTVYTVTATNNGCSSTATVTVFVEGLVCSPATSSSATCSNTNFTVTANHTGGGAPFQYAWSDGVGGSYPNAATITANLPAGTYSFESTVTDNCGGVCTSSITVTVNGLPSVAVNPTSGIICNPGGAAVTLTASGGLSYSWSPTTGLSPTTGSTVSANPTTGTTYIVSGTDANGCVNTATADIQVGKLPSVTASATPSNVCPGSSTQLNVSATVPTAITANNYLFAASTGGLDPMTGATTLIGGQTPVNAGYGDDAIALPNPSPIGFNFVFEGVTFTSFAVSPDGFVKLGSAATADLTNGVLDATNIPKLYPFWDDQNIGTDGHVKVLLSGPSPNQILILEWQTAVGATLTNASTTTYQAWLYETSNVIEFRYGTMANGVSASAGITGNPQTNYKSITYSTNTSSSTAVNNLNTVPPPSGTVYTFTPPVVSLTYSWAPSAGLIPNANDQNPQTPALTTTTVYTVTATFNICSSTATVSVTVATIDDNNACTDDACNTSTGLATHTAVNVDDGDPCTADGCNSVTGVFHTPICNVTLNACVYLQGFYTGNGFMDNFGAGGYMFVSGFPFVPAATSTDVDFVTIGAWECVGSTMTLVDQQTARLQTNGSISVTFSNAVIPGQSYYLRVTHCTSVETWSATPVMLSGITTYSFCNPSPGQAFSGNLVPTSDNLYYAIYSGDMNQDGAVDGSDFLVLDPEIQGGNGGYNCFDLNGDGAVDGSDFLVLDPNIQAGVGAAVPTCP